MAEEKQALATINIKRLRLRAFIGINEDEKKNLQDIIINICIQYPANRAILHKDIDHALNYRTINKTIINYVGQGRFLLLESLVEEVLALVMANKKVCFAEVEIEKPNALRFTDSVSVTLRQHRD